MNRLNRLLTVAALAATSLAAQAFEPDKDPWVLFCHTDPSESRIGTVQTDHLRLDAKTAGAVAQGWYGTTCTIYGKLVATAINPDGTDGATLELPEAPNYIQIVVTLGPTPAGSDRPSVQFSAGATLKANTANGTYEVSFKDGRLIAKGNHTPNPKVADPVYTEYFTLRDWRFMVIKESEAKKWRNAIKVRATLYSND